MKLNLRPLLITLLLISYHAFSQVGIGTTDPQGILEVVSTTQGVVLPKVALTNTTVAAPVVNNSLSGPTLADGTLVYNTNTVNDVFPGYYYWITSRWVRLDPKGKQFITLTLPAEQNHNADFQLLGVNNFIDIYRIDRAIATDAYISGIDGGAHGKSIQIYNLSATHELTLYSEGNAASSDPENRFFLDQDVILKPGRGTILVYDGVVQRWIVFRGDN
ncbi:hypothetical protein POV27_10115 [Aureisphaera galaxeae]|uniref:hypothetical protein n=1 Tax=Aureisphaera galaxeae TaxID=1538023 RepID=UPI0023503D25|nr:hypothetical protein [Aureisphaera galaxeae]MDC8004407.1 hypothetical protein [Aureisphaera galaxeae]